MTTGTIELALPKVDTGSQAFHAQIPALPQAAATDIMATKVDTPATQKTLVCKDLLVGDTRKQAEAEARDLLPKMLDNSAIMTAYATDVLDGTGRLSDQVLRSKPPVNVAEVQEIMKTLSRNMRGAGKKYDPNDAKARERYAKVKGGILEWAHISKTFLEEFLEDVRSMESQFQKAIDTLNDKQFALLKNVGFYDEFYKLNEKEITLLIYKIGVMELIRDLAANQAAAIVVGDASLGDRQGEQKAALAEFVSRMDMKITAYKGKLWVAWAMSPQIRALRMVSLGLADKINETVTIGIPTMKNTLVIWLGMGQAEQAAQLNAAVEELVNQTLAQFAQAAAISVPRIMEANQTPAFKPQTVALMANSLAAEVDSCIQALQNGERMRADLDAAIIAGKQVIDSSSERISEAQIQHVLDIAKRAPQIATSVPVQN